VRNSYTFEEHWPEHCKYRSDVFWEM